MLQWWCCVPKDMGICMNISAYFPSITLLAAESKVILQYFMYLTDILTYGAIYGEWKPITSYDPRVVEYICISDGSHERCVIWNYADCWPYLMCYAHWLIISKESIKFWCNQDVIPNIWLVTFSFIHRNVKTEYSQIMLRNGENFRFLGLLFWWPSSKLHRWWIVPPYFTFTVQIFISI